MLSFVIRSSGPISKHAWSRMYYPVRGKHSITEESIRDVDKSGTPDVSAQWHYASDGGSLGLQRYNAVGTQPVALTHASHSNDRRNVWIRMIFAILVSVCSNSRTALIPWRAAFLSET